MLVTYIVKNVNESVTEEKMSVLFFDIDGTILSDITHEIP